MENYYKGKEDETESINDDLESLFEELRAGKTPSSAKQSYFLPKLTREELKLTEREDPIYPKTFFSNYWDVDKTEMLISESKSKFVYGNCFRETFKINKYGQYQPM